MDGSALARSQPSNLRRVFNNNNKVEQQLDVLFLIHVTEEPDGCRQ